ncbi:putative double-stranded RNA/RNA-DNA hybrid binding protein [Desulfosporosinus orientis DSM 765]|uniref:Ribonuclease H n=1 Tax=Desulfosporosinus orientis (strain ATCC 19365 / DSM 765 / NCIMB 8382 / VKM B-1628 / Singapore I) TaxID=768706 RepID=G7WBQ9_DESOD|nr:ribonuclease H family protein [Desulfosporosinus orientis]AET68817.1 putative double-stranded RNA/RNA-DNA hybrid binding protein [Desulfosporosinus orientis DSM 765]
MVKKNFYAVKKGFKIGLFNTWLECQASVKGYKGAVYKGFEKKTEAVAWLNSEEIRSDPSAHLEGIDFEVYTDGSYVNGRYSYGYVFIKDGEIVLESKGVGEDLEAASMRNVAGEIAAVRHAVEKAISIQARIRIYHDYSGIALWVTGEWQAKNKFTQAYAKFMRAHKEVYELKKVAGHSGDKFNDYVDGLAKEALGIRTKKS